MKILIKIIIALLQTISLIASNNNDYDDDRDTELVSHEEILLNNDLNDPHAARCQIIKNLKQSELYKSISLDFLDHPLICVGTGRNIEKIKHAHHCYTTIRSNDISIDYNPKFLPHIVMNNAFFGKITEGKLQGIFSCVFFAHVGNRLFPLENKDKLKKGLKLYFDHLMENGLFIYNSEVHKKYKLILSDIAKNYNFKDFEFMKKTIIDLITSIGFIDVEFIIKSESEFWTEEELSFLILAKKPKNSF